jgi:hypothetical protein
MLFLGDWAPQETKILLDLDDDFVFLNLEGPVINPSDFDFSGSLEYGKVKAGPKLFHSELPQINGTLIGCLANNHSMDFGVFGIKKTLDALTQENGVQVGFGDNFESAQVPLRIQAHGMRVSIFAIAENQFGMAGCNQPGYAGFGSWIYNAIKRERETCDFLVVSVHAGIEDFPHPAPFFQDLYRSFIDGGANAVIAHHPHVAQGFEWYRDSIIAYGLGNLAVKPDSWMSNPMAFISLGLRFHFDQCPPVIEVLLLEQIDENGKQVVREIIGQKSARFRKYLELLSNPLYNRSELEDIWSVVADECWEKYLSDYILGPESTRKAQNVLKLGVKSILRRFSFLTSPSSSPPLYRELLLFHAIRCESHREIALRALDPDHKVTPEAKKFVHSLRLKLSEIMDS